MAGAMHRGRDKSGPYRVAMNGGWVFHGKIRISSNRYIQIYFLNRIIAPAIHGNTVGARFIAPTGRRALVPPTARPAPVQIILPSTRISHTSGNPINGQQDSIGQFILFSLFVVAFLAWISVGDAAGCTQAM
jgi:hypothetical protein